MSITFSGLATGLDTNSIIDDLMSIERAPIDRIEASLETEKSKLEAFAQFDSKLDELKSIVQDMSLTSQVRSTSVSLSNDDAFTAETTSGAVGSYTVSVAQLSQVQKTVTDGFSSKNDSIGTGSITVNGTVISITEDNDSLSAMVESINEQSDTTGVQATIINDGSEDSPYHLVLTGKDSSTSFTFETALVDGDDAAVTVVQENVQEAQQAVAFIDGIKVISDSNSISSAINGVTIKLDAVSSTSSTGTATAEEIAAGTPAWEWADPPIYATTQMDVKADTESLKEKVTGFVTAYNDIIDWINSGYEEFGGSSEVTVSTDDDAEDSVLGSVLRGDATINTIKRQLQGVLTETINNSGQYQILAEIGLSTDIDGKLLQNNTKLDTALEENFDDVVYLFAGDDDTAGVMKNYNSLLLELTSSTQGMYANEKTAYTSKVSSYDRTLDILEQRMTKRETSLRSQFTAMEALVSSLNSQGDFLTQAFDSLNGD